MVFQSLEVTQGTRAGCGAYTFISLRRSSHIAPDCAINNEVWHIPRRLSVRRSHLAKSGTARGIAFVSICIISI